MNLTQRRPQNENPEYALVRTELDRTVDPIQFISVQFKWDEMRLDRMIWDESCERFFNVLP